MFEQIKSNLKRNMRAVVFVIILIFFVGNYTFSQQQQKQDTKNVLVLLDKIVTDISTTFNQVSDSTLIYNREVGSFNNVSSTLVGLSTRLTNYRLKIPFDKGTKEYIEVTTKLANLIKVSQSQADQFADLYMLYGKNITSLEAYSTVSTIPSLTNTNDAQKLTQVWKNILEIEQKELIKYHDTASKDFYTKSNESNKKTVEEIEKIIEKSPESLSLTDIQPKLIELNTSKYNVFPRLKKEEIQSPEFAQSVADLDKAVDKLKQSERII